MTLFDSILAIILLGFAFRGFSTGLIRMIGSLLGTVIGAFVASHFYLVFFESIRGWFNGLDNLGRVVSFIVLFIVISNVVVFIFKIIDKTYDFLSIIPFLGAINRVGGAILGVLVGGLVIGLLLFVFAKYVVIGTALSGWLMSSEIAPTLIYMAKILMPLLSFSLKNLKSVI